MSGGKKFPVWAFLFFVGAGALFIWGVVIPALSK